MFFTEQVHLPHPIVNVADGLVRFYVAEKLCENSWNIQLIWNCSRLFLKATSHVLESLTEVTHNVDADDALSHSCNWASNGSTEDVSQWHSTLHTLSMLF